MTQQINLYDARLRPRHELATARNLAWSSLATLLVVGALSIYVLQAADGKSAELAILKASVRSEQERMGALSKVIAGRKVSPELLADQAQIRALLAGRQEVMAVLDSGQLGNTSGFSEYMFGFARQARPDLWLTGFTVSGGGDEIEIRGGVLDPAQLAGYVQHLRAEPVFQGRRFSTLEMRSVEPEAPKPDALAVNATALPRYVAFSLRSANAQGRVDKNGKEAGVALGERP